MCRRYGVEAARMEEVATLAQVSKGTLYRFFESKQDLFLASIIDSYEESLRILETQGPPPSDPRARLERILRALGEILAAFGPRMTLHYQAWGVVARDAEFEERLHGFLRGFHSQRAEEIESTIREGQQLGQFRRDADVRAITDSIMALLAGFLYRATFDRESASPARLQACFEGLLARLLLAPGDGPGGGDA